MKSALFESLNDRSNITNAYLKMVNESVEEDASTIEEPIEVAIPDWAVSYIEYADDSGLNDEDKKIVDEYIDGIAADGLRLSFDGEELGFVRQPEFGLASNCVKYYLVKDKPTSNESVEDDGTEEDEIDADYVAGDVVDFLHTKHPSAAFIGETRDSEGNIYLRYDFGRTDTAAVASDLVERFGDAIGFGRGKKEYAPEIGFDVIIVHPPKTVGESAEDAEADVEEDEGWFSPQGELIREIPQECVDACTKPGADAYDDCSYWVDELEFDKGLDIAQAKGFLKSTGGWDDKEIVAFDPKETAVRLLWIICGDLKDGSDLIYIGDAEPFVEESVDAKKVKVIITGIVWPKGSSGLPERDSITIELSDGDDIEERVGQELEAEHKVAPESFKVAKVVEMDGDDTTNEIIDQKELDKLTKKYDIINEKR